MGLWILFNGHRICMGWRNSLFLFMSYNSLYFIFIELTSVFSLRSTKLLKHNKQFTRRKSRFKVRGRKIEKFI